VFTATKKCCLENLALVVRDVVVEIDFLRIFIEHIFGFSMPIMDRLFW